MAGEIDFCITYIADGIDYLKHLIANAKKTADRPELITFRVSFHAKEDRELLKPIEAELGSIIQAKSYKDRNILFWPSANHSAAVNALAAECTGDLSIFCDYDMAFLQKGWDTKLLINGADISGVVYPPHAMQVTFPWAEKQMPWLKHAELVKYQNLPNLSFFAIRQHILRDVFQGRLTHFDDYLGGFNIPFRVINTYKLGMANGLPPGAIQWMDTGYEIPDIILENDLTFVLLKHGELNPLSRWKDNDSPIKRPEVFYLGDNPFIAHYKKGSKKAQAGATYTFDQFKADIDDFLRSDGQLGKVGETGESRIQIATR